MHILLTGGTGLIGRQLCQHWLAQGHRLTVWSRHPEQVIGPVDAVINLAGAPIADRPWTHKRKALLWSSRISLTETLLAWLEGLEQKPAVLISGSAVGWYGDGGERELTEASGPGRTISPASCALPGKKLPSAPKPWGFASCWYGPVWCCRPRAAFCRGCCCRSNWRWAGLSALVGSGCRGYISRIKSP
ncbi:NAD dependent epimerase/dehydratase family domain-containing protein [Ditylenchus destructor]|nr:NAD dependent epimerase/dehydratase family domain-containing protein [Ditylenchus destructor]